jgi:hypothetical protein
MYPLNPVSRAVGQWARRPLVCGACRNAEVVGQALGGVGAHVVIRSPPYATQARVRSFERIRADSAREVCRLVRDRGSELRASFTKVRGI